MDIDKIVEIINSGGIVLVPTDTVYGILGDSLNEKVANKIYKIKNRDKSKPFIILVSDIKMLEKYTKNINDLEKDIISKFWPGKLTIILEKSELIPGAITNNSKYVGIRIPDNEELVEIISKLNRPLISTSANLSGNETITSIGMLDKKIINNVDYIYDNGVIKASASTLIKVLDDKIQVLRDGDLSQSIKTIYKI